MRERYQPTPFPSKILSMLGLQSWFSDQIARIAQSIPWPGEIDLRELVDGLASGGDDAPRWMAGIAKAPDGAAIYPPPLAYQFKTPCVLSQQKGKRIVSHCSPFLDGGAGCPQINWAGSTGERVFFLDRCVGVELDGLSVEIDASGTAYTAVDWDDDGPGMSSRNGVRRFRVHAQHDNDNYVMLRISENAKENHEYYTFEDVQLSGGAGASGPGQGTSKGIGLKIGGIGESKNHQLRGLINLNALGTGIWQVNGSFNAENISCWNNEIDVRADAATESQRIKLNSERSRQALVAGPATSITLEPSSRFGPQWAKPGVGYFEVGELFDMGNVWIDDHVPAGAFLFDFAKHARRATLIGPRFAPNTPFAETGFGTMPLDRSLIALNCDNVIGLPPIYIRGPRARFDFGWNGDGVQRAVEIVLHALGGTPTMVGVSVGYDKTAGAGGTAIPFETQSPMSKP